MTSPDEFSSYGVDETKKSEVVQENQWIENNPNIKSKDFTKEEYTEEDLKKRLKDVKDIGEFKKALEEIVWNMESQFLNISKKYFISLNGYDWSANLDDDWIYYSIFEKKWMELLNKIKAIMDEISVWNAELNLLAEFDKVSSELQKLQSQTDKNIQEDMADWMISNKDFVEATSMIANFESWWRALFDTHNLWGKKYAEALNKLDIPNLLGNVFRIEEWAWAFNDGYEEIKKRLNGRSLFQVIDELTQWESYNREKDWTADVIEGISIKGLFYNWKIDDLNNYLSSYKDADRIKQKIKRSLRMASLWMESQDLLWDDFLEAFLAHYSEIKKAPELSDVVQEFESINPTVKEFPKMKEDLYLKQPDILKEKKTKALVLYDSDTLWWSWQEFFGRNINKYKTNGFLSNAKEIVETEDIKIVETKKSNWDLITFGLLKEKDSKKRDESYARGIKQLKDRWYNLITLRWHCYNTSEMVPNLVEQWMLKEWTILIDGWCWNAKWLRSYVEEWVKSYVFSYKNTWKWFTTEAVFDQILKEKEKWWNLWSLLASIDALSNQKSAVCNRIKTMDKPGTEYNMYMFSKYGKENESASTWDETAPVDMAMNN